ncbi:hypothetical protein LCGC14_2288590 [marine sediment metagenome]|uniref:Uncharacterized protein n=1 Tax=marine sediment metagenome TaxID=412755 RepID=A0A0F9FM33_9ZZZZ
MALSFGLVEWSQVEWLAILIGGWTGVAITHKADKLIRSE